MALGASCVLPLELAGAFAVFARGGTKVEPLFVSRVRRGDQVLFDRASPMDPTLAPARRFDRMVATTLSPPTRVMDAESAYLMTYMLRDVVRRGTARDANVLRRPAAGKTGTTNDNTDAWFVGFTSRVVSAVWVGHDNPARTMGRLDDGHRAALPVWMDLIRVAERGREAAPVPGDRPDSLVRAAIDRETGLLAAPGSASAAVLWFKPGTAPTERAGTVTGVPTNMSRLGREF
jgi:penicillin-binding protein 1A